MDPVLINGTITHPAQKQEATMMFSPSISHLHEQLYFCNIDWNWIFPSIFGDTALIQGLTVLCMNC